MARADPLPAIGAAVAVEELFPGLVAYLVGRFGAGAARATATPLAGGGEIKKGGYGVPYVLSWTREDGGVERLVLETVSPGGFGHEDRADRAAIVLRAADDAAGLPRAGEVVGTGVLKAGGAVDLGESGEPFFLMRFLEGTPYAADLERIAAATTAAAAAAPSALDEARALALADYLVDLHRAPVAHPTWYRRRLRDLCGSGECVAGVADSYPTPRRLDLPIQTDGIPRMPRQPSLPRGFLTAELLQRVEEGCLSWRYRLRDRRDRLRRIHGDFHPWNILFQEGTAFRLLDHSRGAFGDPADDVAALLVNYVFFALRTRAAFEGPFATLFTLFWERYTSRSRDAEIADVIAPHFAFRSLVVASPIWYPNESEETRRRLFRFLLSVLESPRFEPERIPEYLARPEP